MDERICALCKKRVDGPMKHFVGEDLESFATCMTCAPKAKQRQFETVEQTKRQLTTESNTYRSFVEWINLPIVRVSWGAIVLILVLVGLYYR